MNFANVVVIDDDSFVRSSLTAGLKSYGIEVVGSGQNFFSAMEACNKFKVDVAIVDLDLGPGPSGVDICHSLRKKMPNIGLVLLTSYTDPKIADPKMPNLPKGTRFLSKSNLTEFQILVNEVLAAKVKPLAATKRIADSNVLTDVQLQVLKLVAEGYSTSEIADRRAVSVKAVEGIISKIHQELGLEKAKRLNQRVQLTRAYFKLSGKKPPGA